MSAGLDEGGNTPAERTGLDYAREILEKSLTILDNTYTDSCHFAKVCPAVNAAMANFLAAEAAERQDPSK